MNIRPNLMDFIKRLSKHFEIIIFTASQNHYANSVLDYLDPKNEYFYHRLYRENCVLTHQGFYVKDLSVISNRNLKDMVIIDNAIYSFAFQLENGIPIIPFYDNENDDELLILEKFLMKMIDVYDVRNFLKNFFGLNEFGNYLEPYAIIKDIYNEDIFE